MPCFLIYTLWNGAVKKETTIYFIVCDVLLTCVVRRGQTGDSPVLSIL